MNVSVCVYIISYLYFCYRFYVKTFLNLLLFTHLDMLKTTTYVIFSKSVSHITVWKMPILTLDLSLKAVRGPDLKGGLTRLYMKAWELMHLQETWMMNTPDPSGPALKMAVRKSGTTTDMLKIPLMGMPMLIKSKEEMEEQLWRQLKPCPLWYLTLRNGWRWLSRAQIPHVMIQS